MEIKLSNRGNTLIVRLYGELDDHTAEYAKQKIENEIIKPTTKNIVFDFSNLTFMDSSGIGVIMGRYKNIVKINGKVAIACSNPQVIRLLDISGISSIIPIYSEVDSAVKMIRGE
ncbi:MAG: anti-sigma F factor antagonist [Firmicutes bacterium]|nr:anti-sigma F factor antagonist [Bacillota bacterium]